MILYTNHLIPVKFAGYTIGPFIFIRPEYKYDKGLLAHEKVHVAQWFRTFGLHGLFYTFNESYRLKSEVEAYKVQLQYSPGNELRFAGFISEKYNINITTKEAMELLK